LGKGCGKSLKKKKMKNKDNAYVMIGNLHVSLDDVKVLNISEGLFGEDVVTFEYEGQKRESSIYRRP
tara:strand:+ start:1219 stop:1419 length:201 start_codon:yes stop_codon:yes gene_type:complete